MSTIVIDFVVVFALFVFMLALLCFYVATVFSVNKDLYNNRHGPNAEIFSAFASGMGRVVDGACYCRQRGVICVLFTTVSPAKLPNRSRCRSVKLALTRGTVTKWE